MKPMPEGTRRTAGFTLVELMIALVLGLLLTLVVAQLFIGSRRTFATTDDLSRMQENMRFATSIMTRTIRQAGYRTSPNSQAAYVFVTPNLVINGAAGASAATADSLTVSFEGSGTPADNSVINCRGESVAGGVMSSNTFSIVTVNGVPSLVCVTDTAPGVNQVIVADVENMKILYGESTDGDVNADRFVPRGSLANADNVVAVRIAMLFRSPNTNVGVSIAPTSTTWNLNGTAVTTNDSRVRRDSVFTVSLRNRSP
jgi:type IV pilus assembly protein PilW